MKERETPLDEETIKSRLGQELPKWYLENGWIRRKFKTSGWKSTLMVTNTVAFLAESAWHHPDLSITYAEVIVKLTTHSAKGITEKDFALAKVIENTIQWHAQSTHPGVFEGTPDDPRFKMVKFD